MPGTVACCSHDKDSHVHLPGGRTQQPIMIQIMLREMMAAEANWVLPCQLLAITHALNDPSIKKPTMTKPALHLQAMYPSKLDQGCVLVVIPALSRGSAGRLPRGALTAACGAVTAVCRLRGCFGALPGAPVQGRCDCGPGPARDDAADRVAAAADQSLCHQV